MGNGLQLKVALAEAFVLVLLVHPIRHHGVVFAWIFQVHLNDVLPPLRVNQDCFSPSHMSQRPGMPEVRPYQSRLRH